MGNCLVTKLKGVVNNDNLKKLGVFTLKGINGEKNTPVWINIIAGTENSVIAELENATVVTDRGYNIIDSTHMYIPTEVGFVINIPTNTEYKIRFYNKYDIVRIFDENIFDQQGNMYIPEDIEELCYSPLTQFDICIRNNKYLPTLMPSAVNVNGYLQNCAYKTTLTRFSLEEPWGGAYKFIVNIDNLSEFTNLTFIDLENSICSGNLSSLAGLVNLESLSFRGAQGMNLIGNILDLASLVNLEHLDISECINLTGTMESFVQAQRSNGRTTGTLNICGGGNTVTFNGNVLFGGLEQPLTWTENTITYAGVTVNA